MTYRERLKVNDLQACDIMTALYYYVVVLVGHITGLQSLIQSKHVCIASYVIPNQSLSILNSKTKWCRKHKIDVNV